MVTIGERRELAPDVVHSMHEFRHEIFVRRLGWSLPLIDGLERDEYDSEDAVYVIAKDVDERITACARLLPTAGRCMLTDLFSELLGNNPPPSDPLVWELSRFATNIRSTGEGRVLSLSQPTLDLLGSIMAYARRHGVQRLVLVTSVAIERLLLRSGFDAHRVAAPARIEGSLCVALYLDVPAGTDGANSEPTASYHEEAVDTH